MKSMYADAIEQFVTFGWISKTEFRNMVVESVLNSAEFSPITDLNKTPKNELLEMYASLNQLAPNTWSEEELKKCETHFLER